MNISVSEELHSQIIERARRGCYGSTSEYMRALVRRDLKENIYKSPVEETICRPRKANDYMVKRSGR